MTDAIAVTLTREQWERIVNLLGIMLKGPKPPVESFTALYQKNMQAINRAICEQAGLGEEFRCE